MIDKEGKEKKSPSNVALRSRRKREGRYGRWEVRNASFTPALSEPQGCRGVCYRSLGNEHPRQASLALLPLCDDILPQGGANATQRVGLGASNTTDKTNQHGQQALGFCNLDI